MSRLLETLIITLALLTMAVCMLLPVWWWLA